MGPVPFSRPHRIHMALPSDGEESLRTMYGLVTGTGRYRGKKSLLSVQVQNRRSEKISLCKNKKSPLFGFALLSVIYFKLATAALKISLPVACTKL